MKIKIKNISGTNQRLLFRPNSPNANVNIIDPTHNPTLGFEESGSFYFCLGTSEGLPPIDYPFTCEGATPEMYLEQELDDRSRWRLTVNNTVLEVTSQDNDIEAGSIPVLFNHYHEATLSQLGLSLFSSDRILFTNHSNTEMKIRLAPLNIYGVVGIATDNVNRTGGYNSYDRSVEFCLAPIEEPEFAGKTDFAFYSSSNNYLGRFRTLEFQLMGVPLEVDGPIPWRLMGSFNFYPLNLRGYVSDLIAAYNNGMGTFTLSEDSFGVSGLELTENNFRSIFQLSVQDGINYFHYRGTRGGVFRAGGEGMQGSFSITPQTPLKPWNN